MLESTVELLGGLCLSALTVLMSVCIVGSIVAALRAVSRESAEITLSDEDNPPYSTKAKHNGPKSSTPQLHRAFIHRASIASTRFAKCPNGALIGVDLRAWRYPLELQGVHRGKK